MPHQPAYDPTDPRYLRSEVERVFGVCADCRMCVKFCGSFPKLFDAVDDYCTEGKYAEVDTKKLKAADVRAVVDLCFQCKLCYIKCPYTPGDHDYENALNRQLMHSTVGIHKDKKLPSFASETFASQFDRHRKIFQGEPTAKIAFFSTCYVNYNQPEIGTNTLAVMAHNNVDVVFAYECCCGMPHWHNGDMDKAIEAAKQNVADLLRFVEGADRSLPPIRLVRR